MQQRDTYFDFLRGIAIIMVIGIHTYADGQIHFNLFLRQLLNCAVPIFLAISGYFIGHKSFAEQGCYVKFLKKQVPRVYIPMLLWSIPWMLLAIRGGESPIVSIIRTFVGDMSIFYFIILIIQYYALSPLIQRENRKSGGGNYAVIITIIGISLFDYVMRIENAKLSLVESAGIFPVWMIFYVMGVLQVQGIKLPLQNKYPLHYAMLAILLCCVHIYLLHRMNGNVVHGIKLSAHIYSYFIIMWLFTDKARTYYNKIQNKALGRLVVYIGRVSFFMYLTHCLVIFTFFHLHIPDFWSLRWLLCIVLSTLMAYVCDKKCPARMRRYVGF